MDYKYTKIDEIRQRVKEVFINPQAKAKPQQSNDKTWQEKTFREKVNYVLSIIFAIFILIAIGNGIKQFIWGDDKKSQPTQTTQSTQPKQTQKQTQSAQNMPQCNNSALLNHLIKTDKEGWVKYINKDIEFWERTQELGKEKGLNLTDINDYIENRKYDIISVETKSRDTVNRRVVCKAEVTQTDLLLFPNEPLQTSWNYIVQLNNDNSISWGWAQSDNP